ncbi:flagellin N-terminal helical domain-containing protein, partial [Poseidonibacter lekithochrous]
TQIADKAMAEQSNILDIVKTKLVQASTDTTSQEGRDAIGKDITKLLGQLNNIASQTNYNGTELLQASEASTASGTALTFQMGENLADTIATTAGVQSNTVGLALSALKDAASAGTTTGFSAGDTRGFMATVDTALNTLNGWRADFGSTQNQLESAVRNQMTQ